MMPVATKTIFCELLASSAIIFSFLGCEERSRGIPMLTKLEAIEIAKKEFTENGFAIADFDIELKEHHVDPKKWIVWFDRKGEFRAPGGKHGVVVDKHSGAALFQKGQ